VKVMARRDLTTGIRMATRILPMTRLMTHLAICVTLETEGLELYEREEP
jgi:hypothetical protein